MGIASTTPYAGNRAADLWCAELAAFKAANPFPLGKRTPIISVSEARFAAPRIPPATTTLATEKRTFKLGAATGSMAIDASATPGVGARGAAKRPNLASAAISPILMRAL